MVDKDTIRIAILNEVVKNRQVIHGTRAVNNNLPLRLRKETKDYDMLTKNPELSANELKDTLNKKSGKERYVVTPALHKGTFKVKDSETGETIADYTQSKRKPENTNNLGIRYATNKYSKGKIDKMLKDESTNFRRDKDLDTLKRIQEGESLRW